MKTINVELPDSLYTKLKKMMAEAETPTWKKFFEKIASQEIDVYIEILSVDDDSPEGHTVDFKLGDYVYRYKDGQLVLLSSPERHKVSTIIFSRPNKT